MAATSDIASARVLPGKYTGSSLYSIRVANGHRAMDEVLETRIWTKVKSCDALDAVAFYIGYLLTEPHSADEAKGILKEFYGKMRELSLGYWLSREIVGRAKDTLNSVKA
jgi:hypothetical protein